MYKPIKKSISVAILIFIISTIPTYIFLHQKTHYVERIIDGDTVVLENGERVRLLGIDAPETGQYYYKEAKEYLERLILHKNIRLERGLENRDKYGRLLRYIFIDDIFVNLELIKNGYASVLIYKDDKYLELLTNAEFEARKGGIGIWSINITNPFCISIFQFHYNAKGNDNQNLNDEYVIFRNKCTHPINLSGWVLKDANNKTYIFENFILNNKTTVTLHTGSGINNLTDLYWNQKTAVWNNDGDHLSMWDSKGNLILNYSY